MDRCLAHKRMYCMATGKCRQETSSPNDPKHSFTDNSGQLGISYNTGELNIGIGSGMAIDPSDGSLVISGIDTDGQ